MNSNGSSAMSYSPSSHTMPAMFQHRDSFVHQRELESAFCSDLVCCGMRVRDLHELLHHYEEHHHAPIEEEPEPKEEEDDDLMEEDVYPTALPTQPHELAALTSSPLLRKNELRVITSPVVTPTTLLSPTATNVHQQQTEDILKQVFINTNPISNGGDMQYFRSEALYQTCGK